MPQFPHLENESNTSLYIKRLVRDDGKCSETFIA